MVDRSAAKQTNSVSVNGNVSAVEKGRKKSRNSTTKEAARLL
jgi:hypothetical protein